jgi:hypothetical protein
MAQFLTCSYSAFRPDMGTPVRITLGGPRQPEPTGRAHWLYVAELAPRGWYFRSAEFDRHYTAQLDRYAAGIEEKLTRLGEATGSPLVLLCFERRIRGPADCHRRSFAQWWQERTGQQVPELDGKPT